MPASESVRARNLTSLLPAPYGYPEAVQSVGTTAAPLLAGFSFALIGLIVQDESKLRWPNIALALLVGAALLLITTVQCTFTARQYYVPPGEWLGWLDLAGEARAEQLADELEQMLPKQTRWLRRARYSYNFGIATLLLAIATTLVPPGALGSVASARLVAIALALLGLAVELIWTLSGEVTRWKRRRENRRIREEMAQSSAAPLQGPAEEERVPIETARTPDHSNHV
jgi:MFS family permease